MKRAIAWAAAAGLGALGALSACGDEVLAPAPVEASAGQGASNASGGGADSGGSPALKRTVEERNPYGNVAAADNLLWDGDFEWRSTFASQYGWYASPSSTFFSLQSPPLVMGARCKSGIKCAVLDAGWVALALGVSSQAPGLAVSFWAHPAEGGCGSVQAVLISQSNAEAQLPIGPESEEPDESGWCRFSLTTGERKSAIFLYIENQGQGELLIDDAVVQPITAEAGGIAPLPPSGAGLSDEKAEKVRRWAWAATRPRIVPPSDEQIRFEERMRTRRWSR